MESNLDENLREEYLSDWYSEPDYAALERLGAAFIPEHLLTIDDIE